MSDAFERLQRLNLTRFNRVMLYITLFGSVALILDMVLTLDAGGAYQAVRHTAGFVGLAWVTLVYFNTTRAALPLLSEACQEMIARFAPEDWGEADHLSFHQQLPFEKLVRTFALFGMGALMRQLRGELRRRIDERAE